MLLRNLVQKNKIFNSKMSLRQPYEFLLVLDFEATCEKNTKLHPQVSYLQLPKQKYKKIKNDFPTGTIQRCLLF